MLNAELVFSIGAFMVKWICFLIMKKIQPVLSLLWLPFVMSHWTHVSLSLSRYKYHFYHFDVSQQQNMWTWGGIIWKVYILYFYFSIFLFSVFVTLVCLNVIFLPRVCSWCWQIIMRPEFQLFLHCVCRQGPELCGGNFAALLSRAPGGSGRCHQKIQ